MASALLQPVMPNLARAGSSNEQLRDLWKLFSKVKDSMENGRRFENLSWRLWFKSNENKDPGAMATYFNRIGLIGEQQQTSPLSPTFTRAANPSTVTAEVPETSRVQVARTVALPKVAAAATRRVTAGTKSNKTHSASKTHNAVKQRAPAAVAPKVAQEDCVFFIESDSSEEDTIARSPPLVTVKSDSNFRATIAAAANAFAPPVEINPKPAIASAGTRPGERQQTRRATEDRRMRTTSDPLFDKVIPVSSSSSSALSSLLQCSPQRPHAAMTRSLSSAIPIRQLNNDVPFSKLDCPESLRIGLAREHQPIFRYSTGCRNDADAEADALESVLPSYW